MVKQANRPKPPPRYEIASYWKDKEPLFVTDIGEPCCFACGLWEERWRTWGDEKGKPLSLSEIWERAKGLEAAHIIPNGLGGPAIPENYLLLCSRCHRAAPDYKNPILMISWTRLRRHAVAREVEESLKAVQDSGIAAKISFEELARKLPEVILSEEFMSFLKQQTVYVPGKNLSAVITSLVAALCEFSPPELDQKEKDRRRLAQLLKDHPGVMIHEE